MRMGRMDLLTVISHEIGHVLGYTHTEAANGQAELMDATLAAGVRELPTSTTEVSFFDADSGSFLKSDQQSAMTATNEQDEFLLVMDQDLNKPRHELYKVTLDDDNGLLQLHL
jgi:hypothetical protein